MGFQGVLCMWELVFASCHRLIPNKKNKIPKGCLMVMADPSDLGHGKKGGIIINRPGVAFVIN